METIVVDSGRDFAETRPVRLDHRDLGALRAISEVLAQSEENRVTLRRPIGRLRKLPFLLEQGVRHVPPRLDLDEAWCCRAVAIRRLPDGSNAGMAFVVTRS